MLIINALMKHLHKYSSTEDRLLFRNTIGENLQEVAADTAERYIATPLKEGNHAKLIFGLPLAVVNGTSRAIDAVLGGVVGERISVPDGAFGELGRDVKATGSHLLPPRPLKLVADVIRFPGSATSGLLDALGGFDSRGVAARKSVA